MRVVILLLASLIALTPLSAGSAAGVKQDTDGKALVVLVFDRDCKIWCEKVRPVMRQVEREYGDRVQFVELDTTQESLADSKKRAQALGIAKFVDDAADYVPVVMVFDSKHRMSKQLPGPKAKADYEAAIAKVASAKK